MASIRTIKSSLPAGVTAFSTERSTAGAAATAYDAFNCCHYVGDDEAHVERYRRLLADRLGVGVDRLVIPRQTHSLNVAVIADEIPSALDDVDALVTDRTDVALCINTADCVPVVLYDPRARIVGVAHSGWRGTVGGICRQTVRAMETLGAAAADIHAWIGPSICPDCFEVGEEVACRFDPSVVIRRPDWRRPHVDLRGAVIATLTDAGLDPSAITCSGVCSCCNPDRFFSARVHGIASGRTLTVAKLDDISR